MGKHTVKRQGIVNNPAGSKPKYGAVKREAKITIAPEHEAIIKHHGNSKKLSTAIANIAEHLKHGTI